MAIAISNRHEDTLGGKFSLFGETKAVGVTIVIKPALARLASVQHTAWMLVNLLCRFDGIVRTIGLSCPSEVPLVGKVVPLADTNLDFRNTLLAGARAIGVVPIQLDAALEVTIAISDRPYGSEAMYIAGNAWTGGASATPIAMSRLGQESALPFGPYIAACIAAGEVYKAVRMRANDREPLTAAFYSVWTDLSGDEPSSEGPVSLDLDVQVFLAGVGAVGSAFLHTLWACPGLTGKIVMSDNDEAGVDLTNLNRYSLFGRANVGNPKASTAAELLDDSLLQFEPHDAPLQAVEISMPRVVSAVDRNDAREAIQNRYPPRIFSASTLDLRAEVLRCGPPGHGACLRCFNPPEKIPSEEEFREKLKRLSDTELRKLINQDDMTLGEARAWLHKPKCGVPGERLLRYLHPNESNSVFSVGFVSVMAGVMVAAELLKDFVEHGDALSDLKQKALFQFFTPLSKTNRASAYERKHDCPMCAPDSIACRKWEERHRSL